MKVLREQGLSCRQVHAISSVDCIECDFGMPACQLEVVFAVRCYANADYAIMRCLSVCLSVCVCVSITFVHSVKTNKHIFDLRYVKYSMYRQFHRTADRHGVTYAALQSYSLGSIASAVILFFFGFSIYFVSTTKFTLYFLRDEYMELITNHAVSADSIRLKLD